MVKVFSSSVPKKKAYWWFFPWGELWGPSPPNNNYCLTRALNLYLPCALCKEIFSGLHQPPTSILLGLGRVQWVWYEWDDMGGLDSSRPWLCNQQSLQEEEERQ